MKKDFLKSVACLLAVVVGVLLGSPSHAANPFKKFAENLQKAAGKLQNKNMNGNWQGYVAIPGGNPYPVFIAIQADTPIQWTYASAGCAGTLTAAGTDGATQKFTARLSQGICDLGGGVQLTPADNDQLKWEWLDGSGSVAMTALLSRLDEQQAQQLQQQQQLATQSAERRRAARRTQGATAGDAASQAELARSRMATGQAGASQTQNYTRQPAIARQQAGTIQAALEQQHLVSLQLVAAQQQAAAAGRKKSLFKTLQEAGASEPQPAAEVAQAPRELRPMGDIMYIGRTLKGANMRAAPTTSGEVLLVVPQDSAIGVSDRFEDWYMAQAIVDDQYYVGFIHHTLVATELAQIPPPPGAAPREGQTDVAYSGYSERFQEIRGLITAGELEQVETRYSNEEEALREKSKTTDEAKIKQKLGVLRLVERGTLALDQGLYGEALDYFTTSEELVEKKENRGSLRGFLGGAGTKIAETLSGNEELQPYSADGWEKVLMLNYKSIAFLLQGDRRAYNVTRRAIDWQNIEKKKFDQQVADEAAKLEKKNAREEKKRARQVEKAEKARLKKARNADGGDQDPAEAVEPAAPEQPRDQAIAEVLQRMTQPMQHKAESVASAYVNPFGFYVAGMIQEFESYDDPSLRDNARISYSKALELNPSSLALETAVQDMEAFNPPQGVNLVHVVVANGFVPEKKVLTYQMKTEAGRLLPLKLPLYQPVETRVARIEVHSRAGKKLGTLSTVADVEALCLRQQQDMQKLQVLRAFASYLVSGYLAGTADASTGLVSEAFAAVGEARDENAAPDTRSWMSLPATIQATRLRLKQGVDQLRIVTFDDQGKRLDSELVSVKPDDHGVVYARTTDGHIYPQSSENLWMY